MNDKVNGESGIVQALKTFGEIIVDDRKEGKEQITKLTSAVKQLTLQHVETKKDREFDSSRMERIEDNQKEQGQELKAISDSVLLLDDHMKTNKSKWDTVDKIKAAVFTAILIGATLAYFGLR